MLSNSLGATLSLQAERRSTAEAVVFPSSRITYAGLEERANQFAGALLDLGVQSGDRVGILLNVTTEYVAMLFAAWKIGAIAVPINARFRQAEIRHMVVHPGVKVLVTERADPGAPDFLQLLRESFADLPEEFIGRVELESAPELEAIVEIDRSDRPSAAFLTGTIARPEDPSSIERVLEAQSAVESGDTAVLVYTSGTTAAPKGAMLSHRALLLVADGLKERLMMTGEDRMWTAIPLFHGGGIDFLLSCIVSGATFIHQGYFDPSTVLPLIDKERVTLALPAFETIWVPVLNQPDFDKFDLSSIRVVLLVGVPERLREMYARIPNGEIVACVAMTEASAFISLSRLDDPLEARLTTGGLPLPGIEARIVDPESGEDLGPDQPGELWFRGPNRFSGYFRDEELTREVIDEDGWFRTGDICVRDSEGRLSFLSRLKDMLKVGGENVAAAEVEGYLLTHPAVEIAQVVAAPDARYVEVPAAFIQLKQGATLTAEEVIEYCIDNIASFRVPRYVRFVTEWPMSGTKVKKFELRERIARELREAGITEAPKVRSRWKAS